MNARDLLDLVDWRRRVFEIYRRARLAEDPGGAWESWRRERDELFRHHPQSPIPPAEREGFNGLRYFDYNPEARALATVEYPEDQSTIVLEASEGTMELLRFGRAEFELFGQPMKLDLFWFQTYGGGLFLSFTDRTSGKLTYGGCRYLLDTVKGADLGMVDGRLVLDFNFSYQPSCAYDPRWVCPLAPPANRLSVEVLAGEKFA